MNYKLSQILEAQKKLQSIDLHSVNQNINFLITQGNFFQFEKKGYFKRYRDGTLTVDEVLQIVDEFDQFLENKRKILHLQLLKKINNDPYMFCWLEEKDYLNHRSKWFSSELVSYVGSLLGGYVDWKYPVIYFEPNSGDLMRTIGAGDPFYIVDDLNLPYAEILKKFPPESVNRFFHYTKAQAMEYFDKNSAGLVVSWKNFPFMKLGQIKKDLALMKDFTAPGGIIMFDYVDASSVIGAREIELGKCSFQWKERIHQFLKELELEIIQEIDEHGEYPFNIIICKTPGEKKTLNLNNKIGLVLLDEQIAIEKRKQETKLKKYYRSIKSDYEKDIENLKKRDQELRILDQERQLDPRKILESKLKVALKNLDIQRSTYQSNSHPAVLEAVLHASKLTFYLGRHKDSYNLLNIIKKNVKKLNSESRLFKDYTDWLNFLNNT